MVKFQESTRDQLFVFLFETVVRSPLNKTRWFHFELTTVGRCTHPYKKATQFITFKGVMVFIKHLSSRYSESGRSIILRHTHEPGCLVYIGDEILPSYLGMIS